MRAVSPRSRWISQAAENKEFVNLTTDIKKATLKRVAFLISVVCLGDYSPGMIASEGQTSAQVPHSMHVSGSIT